MYRGHIQTMVQRTETNENIFIDDEFACTHEIPNMILRKKHYITANSKFLLL